jgi:hypothetical protein
MRSQTKIDVIAGYLAGATTTSLSGHRSPSHDSHDRAPRADKKRTSFRRFQRAICQSGADGP